MEINVFKKGKPDIILQDYLKFGCGTIWGVFPSMTPRSLIVRDPPGSSRALRRSRTEALQTQHITCIFNLLLYVYHQISHSFRIRI